MELKAVLCDLDGTLVDSNHLHAEAWQRSFEHFGYHVTFDEAVHQIGKGGDQLIPVFIPEGERERIEAPLKEYRKNLFHAEYFDKVKPFPAAKDLIQRMKDTGLQIAIATSASKEDLAKIKKIAGIEELVDKEVSSDDAETSKPAPDIFEAALKRLDLPGKEAIALGDTPWDVQAAAKAGVKTVALTSGGWAEDDLRKAGAIEVYRDAAELLEQFEQSAFNKR